jgi:hypothetical protein
VCCCCWLKTIALQKTKSELILLTDLISNTHEYPKKLMVFVGDQRIKGHKTVEMKY